MLGEKANILDLSDGTHNTITLEILNFGHFYRF